MMKRKDIIRVAYAEDHPGMRFAMETMFKDSEFIKLELLAANGKDMISLLENATTLPDVCIIDISMPLMDGFQLQEVIKKRWPEMKTLIYTVHDVESIVVRMLSLGVNGYLTKSGDFQEVVEAIYSIHTNGFYNSSFADARKKYEVEHEKIKLPKLTEAEVELLKIVNTGLEYTEIAEKLNKSIGSIEGTRDRLYKKLHIRNKVEMVKFAEQHGYALSSDE